MHGQEGVCGERQGPKCFSAQAENPSNLDAQRSLKSLLHHPNPVFPSATRFAPVQESFGALGVKTFCTSPNHFGEYSIFGPLPALLGRNGHGGPLG